MKLKLIIILALFYLPVKAESAASDDLLHLSAHFGSSYAINMVTFGICEKGLGLRKKDSFIIAGITTLSLGIIYKVVQFASVPTTAKSAVLDTTGILVSDLTLLAFRW